MSSNKEKGSILAEAEGKTPDPAFGGNISFIPFAFHLVPQRGLAKVAAVMRKGERKERKGWERVPVKEHINHAICHLMCYLDGRHDKSHLANAGCRVLMALNLDGSEPNPRVSAVPLPPTNELDSDNTFWLEEEPIPAQTKKGYFQVGDPVILWDSAFDGPVLGNVSDLVPDYTGMIEVIILDGVPQKCWPAQLTHDTLRKKPGVKTEKEVNYPNGNPSP